MEAGSHDRDSGDRGPLSNGSSGAAATSRSNLITRFAETIRSAEFALRGAIWRNETLRGGVAQSF